MEEGSEDFAREYIDLKMVATSVNNKFSALVEETGVNLVIRIDSRTPPVFCNKDRIEQVFINLIENAIRHTPAGGKVLVTTSLKADKVMLQISDTSTGIPEEDLPMIWERFYKADKSRTGDRVVEPA